MFLIIQAGFGILSSNAVLLSLKKVYYNQNPSCFIQRRSIQIIQHLWLFVPHFQYWDYVSWFCEAIRQHKIHAIYWQENLAKKDRMYASVIDNYFLPDFPRDLWPLFGRLGWAAGVSVFVRSSDSSTAPPWWPFLESCTTLNNCHSFDLQAISLNVLGDFWSASVWDFGLRDVIEELKNGCVSARKEHTLCRYHNYLICECRPDNFQSLDV